MGKTSAAQLAASKRYYESRRTDAAWMAAKREKQRALLEANRERYNANARERHTVARVLQEFERVLEAEPELAEAFLTEALALASS